MRFANDIFISYAYLDDLPVMEVKPVGCQVSTDLYWPLWLNISVKNADEIS